MGRILPQIKEATTLSDKLRYALVMTWLRGVWFFVDFWVSSKIKEIAVTNETFKLVDISKLTSVEYKQLRSFRDETAKQFQKLQRLLAESDSTPLYLMKTMKRHISPLEERITILDNLFAQVNLSESHIEGFRVISEEEVWENRTTAYQYAT